MLERELIKLRESEMRATAERQRRAEAARARRRPAARAASALSVGLYRAACRLESYGSAASAR